MSTKKVSKALDLAHSFAELEQITEWFENDKGNIDQGLVHFERAMQLAEELKQRLDQAENKIRDMKKTFKDI
jgi:exodeoxyribonuclease VII small subunit